MSKLLIGLALVTLGISIMVYTDAVQIELQADTRGMLQMIVNGAFAALGYGAGQEMERRKK